jgi:diguanylate cyclase (GGDEF)-like protein
MAKIIRDLSQLVMTRQQARTDELTGLANRRALLEALDQVAAHHSGGSLLLIDLDRFKDVNDRHGHAVGDQLLCGISRRLQAVTPADGLLVRLGGDEFAVLLVSARPSEAAAVAATIVATVEAVRAVDGLPVDVGASVGVANDLSGHDGGAGSLGSGEMLRRADVAMYVAKQSRSGFSVYDTALDGLARDRALLLEELRMVVAGLPDAASSEQIVVDYQAQLDACSLRVVGVEALVRWNHPRLGTLAPAEFLDIAEEQGLMRGLTAHVLARAAAQAMRWQPEAGELRVAVNLSTSSLADPHLLDDLDFALFESGLAPSALTVEITETTLMSDPELSLETVRQIVSRGVGVSIDDYGTGYSSLAYLNDLPATELKLDRTLTVRLTTDERTTAIVAGTIELAHRLGLRVVAEGVEDEATLCALQGLGCDEVQGYLFGRPSATPLLDRSALASGDSPPDAATHEIAEPDAHPRPAPYDGSTAQRVLSPADAAGVPQAS